MRTLISLRKKSNPTGLTWKHPKQSTKRLDVYTNMYRKVAKEERLAAGNNLSQYERAYRQAFVDAVKEADVGWKIGKPIKAGILDSITREIVETKIHIPKSVDVKI